MVGDTSLLHDEREKEVDVLIGGQCKCDISRSFYDGAVGFSHVDGCLVVKAKDGVVWVVYSRCWRCRRRRGS